MTSHNSRLPRHFYRMPPRPCPYLPGRTEQNIFTELVGPDSRPIYDILTHAGFRRSHGIAYRPACPGCQACVPVRIVAREFEMSKSLKRIANRNADVTSDEAPPRASLEHYRLFSRYVTARHDDGEMADMTYIDYAAMVEESPLPSHLEEYRNDRGELIGACLTDRLSDGFSAVYSYFEPTLDDRSLGTLMVIDLVTKAQRERLSYVYLGYWIEGSRKMSYKTRFRPLEALGPGGWSRMNR